MNQIDPNLPSVPHTAASVTGRWTVLRPISREDHPTFFRWRADLLELHLWNSPRRVPTWEEFQGEMEQITRTSILFLSAAKDNGEPFGFVQAYNMNQNDGWCFTSIYTSPGFRRTAHAAEAYIALIEYLFRSFPMRKVYADIFEFNADALKPLLTGGFVEEGRFRQHTWHDDRYWDVIRLAMYRDAWNAVRDRARNLLGIAEEAREILEEKQLARDGGLIT